MQKRSGELLYSASDIVNFLECEHITTLDLKNLETPLPKAEDDDSAKLIQAKGFAHEANYVERARTRHHSFVNIADTANGLDAQVAATLDAMRSGIEVIYQAAFRDESLIGHADFLRRVPRPSSLGAYSYEVLDTKLARTTKSKFVVQLAHYSHLLAKAQGADPLLMHVVLGDQREDSYRYADFARYYRSLLERFMARVGVPGRDTYPEPCARCDLCQWRDLLRSSMGCGRPSESSRRHHADSDREAERRRRADNAGPGDTASDGLNSKDGTGDSGPGPAPSSTPGSGSRNWRAPARATTRSGSGTPRIQTPASAGPWRPVLRYGGRPV